MTPEKKYDAVVIGSGQGGVPLAVALAHGGWKVAIVERRHVGGTCVNVGCTPTKTMVGSARVAHLVRRAGEYGIQTGELTIQQRVIRRRKRDIVSMFSEGSRRRLDATEGIDLIMGTAGFAGPKTIHINANEGADFEIAAEKIFINAGARPRIPKIEGLDQIPFLDSTSVMELDETPEHLIVIGGGYIGLEFGQMFRRFGSRVTIVHRGKQLLAREDSDVAKEVANVLRGEGIEVLLNTNTMRVSQQGAEIEVICQDAAKDERRFQGTHILMAVGRVPNTDGLGLQNAGIESDDHGYVKVNEHLETSAPGIYALGDIKGGPAFTHISYDDFRILRANILENENKSTVNRLIPYTVFIDPQLGRIGLSEWEAKQRGMDYRVAKLPMNYVARALEIDESLGFMKVLVDSQTERILGAAILGVEGGEVMSMLEIAMLGQLPYTALRDAVFAHPTLAESLNSLFSSFAE